MTDEELDAQARRDAGRSCSTCASSPRPARSRTARGCGREARDRPHPDASSTSAKPALRGRREMADEKKTERTTDETVDETRRGRPSTRPADEAATPRPPRRRPTEARRRGAPRPRRPSRRRPPCRRGAGGRGACGRGAGAPSEPRRRRGAVAEEPAAEEPRRRRACRRGARRRGRAEAAAEAEPSLPPRPSRSRARAPSPSAAAGGRRAAVRPEAEAAEAPAARRAPAAARARSAARAATGERKPIVRLPKPERERGRRQERRGVVVSAAMDKTIVVRVDTIKAHPRYKKVVRRSSKFHAHDERNAGEGRRRRPHRRDAPAVEDEELASRRDRRGCAK